MSAATVSTKLIFSLPVELRLDIVDHVVHAERLRQWKERCREWKLRWDAAKAKWEATKQAYPAARRVLL